MFNSIQIFIIRLLQFLMLSIIVVSLTSTITKADPFDDCVNRQLQNYKQPTKFQFPDNPKGTGCNTGKTDPLTGERDPCDVDVCYDAPPNRTIASDVQVRDTGAAGSEHNYSGPNYTTDTNGRTVKVCAHVHARSAAREDGSGSGWQHVLLTGTTEGFISKELITEISKNCAKEVYGGGR